MNVKLSRFHDGVISYNATVIIKITSEEHNPPKDVTKIVIILKKQNLTSARCLEIQALRLLKTGVQSQSVVSESVESVVF